MPENNTVLDESILNSIKKLLGIALENTVYDDVVALHINTALADIVSMGVGPKDGYRISGSDNQWSEFLGNVKPELIENTKTLVYIKVRLIFDPPKNSAIIESFSARAKEIEYRIYTEKGGY